MASYFGGPILIPNNSALTLENALGNTVAIKAAPGSFVNYTLTLPVNDGASSQYLQTDGDGTLSWQTVSGGSSAADEITLGDSNVLVSTTSGEVRINAATGETVELQVNDVNVGVISSTGLAVTGTATATTSFTPATSDGASLGTTSLQFSDLFLADGGVVNFNNGDLTLTHGTNLLTVGGGNLLMATTNQLQFRDSTEYINSSVDGQLDLVAGTSVNIDAALIITDNGITSNGAIVPDTVAGAALGSASAEWSDLYLADDANIYLGNDQSVILTHEPGAGIILQGTSKLHFGDTTSNVSSSSSGKLDIDATTEIEIAAPLIDLQGDDTTMSGNCDVNGTFQLGIDTFDYDGSKRDITAGSNVASVKYIAISGDGQEATYWCNAAPKGTGSMMHIFYMDAGDGTSNANIDFSASNLYTGAGLANYLVFNQTGQSAHMIYIVDSANDKNGWRIINVGGQIF